MEEGLGSSDDLARGASPTAQHTHRPGYRLCLLLVNVSDTSVSGATSTSCFPDVAKPTVRAVRNSRTICRFQARCDGILAPRSRNARWSSRLIRICGSTTFPQVRQRHSSIQDSSGLSALIYRSMVIRPLHRSHIMGHLLASMRCATEASLYRPASGRESPHWAGPQHVPYPPQPSSSNPE